MDTEEKEEVKKQLARVLFILESDNKTHQKGVVERVSDIDRKLTDLLTREKVYKAKATTWGIIGGALSTVLLWFLKFGIAKVF